MIFPTTIPTLIGAHRGASAEAPENTIAAFDLAVAQGADLIECDVHATADGVLVIHHDFTLSRTAGCAAMVGDLTLAELGALDVGGWRDFAFTGQRIPTLDQVCMRYGQRVLLNLEIKFEHAPYDGIEAAVARMVRKFDLLERVVVSSFDLETVLRLRRLDPGVRVALLHDAGKSTALPRGLDARSITGASMVLASASGMVGIHLDGASITEDVCAQARSLGLGVLAWTVDSPGEMLRLLDLGVDAIVSNHPARLREIVQKWRETRTVTGDHSG